MCFSVLFFFFFKQKTAYEMRISDWSSDVCSSDLLNQQRQLTIGADLAQGVVSGVAMQDIHNLPLMKNMPLGVHEMSVGQQKWQAEMIKNFIIAVISGTFLVFAVLRSEEHTSELQSLMRISYAVFCLKKKNIITIKTINV